MKKLVLLQTDFWSLWQKFDKLEQMYNSVGTIKRHVKSMHKDESFKNEMDKASSIEALMNTLKVLHENGIHTVLFMSPIFPAITEYKEIIEKSRLFVDEYWFENLNLRGEYKAQILRYINEKYPQYADLYK